MYITHPLIKPDLVQARDYQTDIYESCKGKNSLIVLPTGCGKCLGIGTPILMYDGTIKPVETVNIGDLLMGPDSKPRTVLSTTQGVDEMYEIRPVKGEVWRCNKSHILNLEATQEGRGVNRGRMNISVEDYLKKSNTFKHVMKLRRSPVEFPQSDVDMDPYIVGVWLGDGDKDSPRITNSDPEIISEIYKFGEGLGLSPKTTPDGNTAYHSLTNGNYTAGRLDSNPFRSFLREYCVINDEKRIPPQFLINSREIRLQMLAGLLDTDGYLIGNNYEIITKYGGLSDDILFLARSLGLCATHRMKKGAIKSLNFEGDYHRIFISGEVDMIPCKVERKIASKRKQIKNILRTGFKVVSIGMGNYYGFELDGDGLFLLGDFTVTHNSACALYLIADKIQEGKCLMMAPTKPLVEQHVNYYRNLLQINPEDIILFTGSISPKKRKEMWEKGRLILATPQTIQNDLANGTYVLDDVSLVVFDETHRLSGDYAYGEIATLYREQNPNGQLIGMTASPGSDEEKVDNILETLGVTHIVSKKDTDPDVAKYLHKKEVTPIFFDLPQELLEARNHLKEVMDGYIKQIRELGIDGIDVPNRTLSMKNLNEIKAGIDRAIGQNDSRGYAGASLYAGIMKLRHGISMAESQGLLPLKKYIMKLYDEGMSTSGSKASKNLIRHPLYQRVYASALYWEEEIHPKLTHLPTIILEELDANPDAKVIVFASFRDTVNVIVSTLKEHGISATRFVGQAKDGLNQRKQKSTLDQFREGKYKVLVSTSVGEEGLDVPATNCVVFYEPTPSPVRNVQRRGRTGRHDDGRVIILITKGTIDEVYWNVAKKRESSGWAI